MSGRMLELRLEDALGAWPPHLLKDPEETTRLAAALEFFDRALVGGFDQAVTLAVAYTPEDEPSAEALARSAFKAAAALTLLRFGVRIVGLEEEAPPPMACWCGNLAAGYSGDRPLCKDHLALETMP